MHIDILHVNIDKPFCKMGAQTLVLGAARCQPNRI